MILFGDFIFNEEDIVYGEIEESSVERDKYNVSIELRDRRGFPVLEGVNKAAAVEALNEILNKVNSLRIDRY